MKNLYATVALASAFLFNLSANAMDTNSQAQQPMAQQPAMAVMTVEQVQGLADDTPVMLEGMIVQSLGDEKYTFQDAAGNTLTVEIDDDDWNGMQPNPQAMVVITGEVDKEGNITEIDVDTIAPKQ
ncbi:MAG: NirD/YgiW/YdeI family stress tolerance protein [Alphaproteobacteria bacterium]|nr:NirD/YgiW/YdeI family stress tolerance protein [Alphaproteobacteria bacterium]